MDHLAKREILIVGDDLTVVDRLIGALEAHYSVREAWTIEEAVFALLAREPAALVVDHQLGGISAEPLLAFAAESTPSVRRVVRCAAASRGDGAGLIERQLAHAAFVDRDPPMLLHAIITDLLRRGANVLAVRATSPHLSARRSGYGRAG